ncbi:signal transduction histidine kinase/ligand-binding sensor domain-containing protein/DNA-binding response OmpR family regulator [Dysgonomonas sp. PFB1-18]|nr:MULTISPECIES: two-component regulator propeller domain-containing protein [unclassified Dysgonomonas]MDH6309500.1 signal transduction histidine kinase/ligand-binding sensor domain-containing protein/DNA-binding response OmpR family regulator [Dysgonomonas sp. PF1-14]MDH6339172.1 signal transduction histidine kinase/ligand-binding sensor domain-containing protein/DNA-binding response OmpR family regulator [Dysgonomonas sp. PF1-16]MDH6380541.1 signal transduction histidine kinase/ligand-binding
MLWIISITVKAELTNNMFDIRHIGYSEGLSSQRVFSIVEDNHGVIWIATKVGIDRYNGQTVKSYTLPGDFHYGDMAGRRLRLLYNERYGGLWAYDHTGRIYRYSVSNDCFEQDLFLGEYISGEIILNKLCLDHNGTLWFGLSKGLYKKEADGRISSIVPEQYVNDIISTGKSLFVGTSKGVMKLSHSGLSQPYWLIEGKDIQTLFCDVAKDELWVGTFNNGLWVMNLTTSSLLFLEGQGSGFLNPIRDITIYDTHTVLVGIDGGGVYTVDRDSKKTHLLMSTEDSTDIFLRGNGIYAVTKDRQGNIWIGSYSGGVSVAILSRYPITILAHERGNPQSLANNNVDDIEENSNGDLWFATDDGISIRNASSYRWNHTLKGNVIITLCKDEKGSVWAGTYGDGIYLLNSGGQVIRHLTKQGGELTTNYIFSIRQDIDGDLWVGGLDGDLLIMDKEGQHKKSYNIKWVHSIQVLDHDQIAVATVNGFCLVNKRSGDIQRYATFQEFLNQNASAYIISMLFNDDGTVWLGTEGGGLNLYDMHTRKARTFTTQEGLPSDDVYSLQKDSRGRLWVSTGKGLALIENFQVSNLNYLGDIDKEYNKSSFVRLADGKFAYGSTNGVVCITPNAIAATNYQAPLRFTGLTIEYLDTDQEKRLRPVIYDMLTNGTVRLDYSHNSFAITFESINHRFQRDIAYQYILDGYEKSWSNLSPNGMVRYTNVSPGSYLLKVRSLRQSNKEIISERTLILEVSQPWWNSWWAWMFYICIAAIIFYFILRYNSNRLQKKYDEDKIRFFIDTAHDIRTPVTLIMAPLEDLSKEEGLPDKLQYFLELARNNTHKLYTLVTQLLEFEKVDTHKKQLILTPLNLNDILAEEIASFQPFCDKKQLHLSLSLPDEDVYIMADKHMVEIMLDNLVSNACKYTMPQGEVCLSLNSTKRKAIIEIKDSGIGIPKKDRKYLFTDVYRAENARRSQEGGTGFGLLQVHRIIKMLQGKISFRSEENKGSIFTITLKRTDSVPQPVSKPTVTSKESLPAEITDITERESSETINISRQGEMNTLLIVEDNEALRYYLRKTFEYDYRVVDVSDGQEALSYLTNEYPDLILSDVMMPGIQGDELCKLVKDNPDTSGIPFVLLTAKVSHDATVEGLKKGADDYIPKPFSTEILKLKVHTLIQNRNRQRDFFMRQVIKQVEADKPSTDSQQSRIEIETTEASDSKTDELSINIQSESDRKFVIQATQLVIENISDTDFNINTLCREMAMSRTLFYSRLKSLTGNGPQEFIRIIRLQKAAELLKEDRNVTEVALETGFVNTKYFSSLFKKQFGVQPSKYSE